MKKFSFIHLFSSIVMLMSTHVVAQKACGVQAKWELAARMENADGSVSTGFAGAIFGKLGDALIVAGGANFPDKKPWEGGTKNYTNEIHVLERKAGRFVWNKLNTARLTEPVAYSGSAQMDDCIVYAGGENSNGITDRAFMLKLNKANTSITVQELPQLPVALTNVALASIGKVVYAVGGDMASSSSNALYSLHLTREKLQWKQLPSLPIALANAAAVAQNGCLYVIGGRTKTASGISELHNTVFSYDPQKQAWKNCSLISDGKNEMNFSAGSAVPINDSLILLTGGDNGKVFHEIETYLHRIANASTDEERMKLTVEKNKLTTDHTGFYKGMLLYNIVADNWRKIGELPFPAHVTAKAIVEGNDIFLSTGEIKPGVRTPDIMTGKIHID